MAKLTKKIIDGLELPKSKPYFMWDDEITGFGIKINPTGKVYVAQKRVNGKARRATIGKHGPYTVQQARDEAKRKLYEMSQGVDPTVEKQRKKASQITFGEVSKDYIRDRDLKPSTVNDIKKRVEGPLSPWKDKPLVDITRDDVLKLFRKLSDRGNAMANLSMRVARALFNYAVEAYRPGDKPIILENPVNVLSGAKMWHHVAPKNRRIPLDKIGAAWIHLERLREDPSTTMAARSIVDAVAFAMLTGGRWGEVSSLTWDRVNLDAGTWHIADSKNKNPVTLPLSSQAKTILENRPRYNTFVFCSNKSKTGHTGPSRFITDQLAKMAGVDLSAHDLRRTFRAVAAETGVELWRTKLLMNHRLNGDITISAYTEKADLQYLSDDIEKIGAWIEHQGQIAGAENVVDLSVRRKKRGA